MKNKALLALWLTGLNLFFTTLTGFTLDSSRPPNIVLILADDMAWYDCGAYGSDQVFTPHIDRLAAEGLCFDGMFTSTAMCAPTRQQLYTGMWPMRNGAYRNHSKVKKGVRSLPHHLAELGYRVALGGKTHFGPPESFPFEIINMNKDTADLGEVPAFLAGEEPFCLIYASSNPHTPYKAKNAQYDPSALTVPPHLLDTPETRREIVDYYAEISMLDQQVGAVMEALERSGRADNTILIFTSEQGSAFPFGGKWTCYENGLKTAFIVRWPGVVAPGTRNQALTQYVDVLPTLIAAAGGDPTQCDTGIRGAPDGGRSFDGISFLEVVQGKKSTHRDHVFGIHTTRGIIHGSEYYPIRSVRDSRYKLIWNPHYEGEFQCVASGKLQKWVDSMPPEDREAHGDRIAFWAKRPEWEFYDLETDPNELQNLADTGQHQERFSALREVLESWMTQQGDRLPKKKRAK